MNAAIGPATSYLRGSRVIDKLGTFLVVFVRSEEYVGGQDECLAGNLIGP